MGKCKLCCSTEASKIESHIIPKWMSKSMLKTNNGSNKGFLLNTTTAHKPRKSSQDTDKESYLLCEGCEKYFGIIENWFKSSVHDQLHSIPKTKNYSLKHNGLGVKWAEFYDPNMIILARLFYYSILWRTSVCSKELWKNIHLPKEEEEYFRNILIKCKSSNKLGVENLFPLVQLKDSPWFMVITCLNIKNKTENWLAGFLTKFGIYKFFLNEQTLTISFPPNEFQKKMELVNNKSEDKILKIVLVDNDFWTDQKEHNLKLMVNNVIKNLKESGNEYYYNRKNNE